MQDELAEAVEPAAEFGGGPERVCDASQGPTRGLAFFHCYTTTLVRINTHGSI